MARNQLARRTTARPGPQTRRSPGFLDLGVVAVALCPGRGPCSGGLLPPRRKVQIELNQLDGTVGCSLTNHGDPRDDQSADHQETVVSPSRDRRGHGVESERELVHDPQQLIGLEVASRRQVVCAFRRQLTIQVGEEVSGRPNTTPIEAHEAPSIRTREASPAGRSVAQAGHVPEPRTPPGPR